MTSSLTDWARKTAKTVIPIHPETLRQLRAKAADENTHISTLSEIINLDPGLTISLLRKCNERAADKNGNEITTMSQAFMLLGSKNVVQLAMKLPVLDKTVKQDVKKRLLFTFSRVYHAAFQAMQWATFRRDMTPEEIFVACQLHFLAELLIATHEPEMLDQIDHMRKTRHIPSEEAQYLVLGFTLDELSSEIAEQWHLPTLVKEALHAENANFPRAYGIMLAVQLSRNASVHWLSERTQQIIKSAAEWLNEDLDIVITSCHQDAVQAARNTVFYQTTSAAERMLYIPREKTLSMVNSAPHAVDICLIPQLPSLKNNLKSIHASAIKQPRDFILSILKTMHDCIGLNRAIFALYNNEDKKLVTYQATGADNDPDFNRIAISTSTKNIFSLLLTKTQAIAINNSNREKFWPLVPKEFIKATKTNSFVAMSVFLNNSPLGVFYADRHSKECQIDELSYKYFKTLCKEANLALAKSENINFN